MRRNDRIGEVYLLSNLRRAYLATARSTEDHEEIRKWVTSKRGNPAQVEGTGGMLRMASASRRIASSGSTGDQFFEIFHESGLKFLYDPEGHMNKFVRDE